MDMAKSLVCDFFFVQHTDMAFGRIPVSLERPRTTRNYPEPCSSDVSMQARRGTTVGGFVGARQETPYDIAAGSLIQGIKKDTTVSNVLK